MHALGDDVAKASSPSRPERVCCCERESTSWVGELVRVKVCEFNPLPRVHGIVKNTNTWSSVIMASSTNPHTVPGMGYIKGNPAPRAHLLEKVACRTKCGEVELKITLTPKFLAKPLREALVEPFLKVHTKRAAAAVGWEQIVCIKIDGAPIDVDATTLASLPCEHLLKKAEVGVTLLTCLPPTLLDALMEVAREHDEVTYENYRNPPPPPMARELMRIATAAYDVDANPPDADTLRRASNAFEAVSQGSATASGASVRRALLSDGYMQSLIFPQKSPHTKVLLDKVRRMAVDTTVNRSSATAPAPAAADAPTAVDVSAGEGDALPPPPQSGAAASSPGADALELPAFTRFFAALCAAACAPSTAAEEAPEPSSTSQASEGGAGGFIQQLMDDDSCTVRQVR